MLETVNVQLDEGAYMPERAHGTDAGADLRCIKGGIIPPRMSATIDTGVHVEIPAGYVGMVKAKSGLNVKKNITATGVIDAGYSGSIVVKLYNHGGAPVSIEDGDKVAQLVILPVKTPAFVQVDAIGAGERGECGFGSTGR